LFNNNFGFFVICDNLIFASSDKLFERGAAADKITLTDEISNFSTTGCFAKAKIIGGTQCKRLTLNSWIAVKYLTKSNFDNIIEQQPSLNDPVKNI